MRTYLSLQVSRETATPANLRSLFADDIANGLAQRCERFFTTRHPRLAGAAFFAALALAPFAWRVNTDPWYSFLFSWETKLEELDKPEYGRIGRTFISQDRRRGRFILRMEETARSRPRAAIIREIEAVVRAQGFRMIGGLYSLQGELSELVQGSVLRGLGGLLAAFAVIVLVVTRSIRSALAMTICLALTPLALFGLVGLLRMPLDIIAAPAANVALP